MSRGLDPDDILARAGTGLAEHLTSDVPPSEYHIHAAVTGAKVGGMLGGPMGALAGASLGFVGGFLAIMAEVIIWGPEDDRKT